MLEKMDAFFEARLDGYDEHMMTNIAFAGEFYPFTAEQLPGQPGARVLDLGCGTGLELEYYFARNPEARVTGIDLSEGMLRVLKRKFPGRQLETVKGSYFDMPFGEEVYDAAVSVESLHHFTGEEKVPLYKKLYSALKPGGFFVLTDYFAENDGEEQQHREALVRLKKAQGIADSEFYHYDTPLTVEHECRVLQAAGFCDIKVLGRWGATGTLIGWRPLQ